MAKLIREGKIKENVVEERAGEFEGTCEYCDAVFSFVISESFIASEIRSGYRTDYMYVTCPFCKQDANVANFKVGNAPFWTRVTEIIKGGT